MKLADLWHDNPSVAFWEPHRLLISEEILSTSSKAQRGSGFELAYGFHASPFGEVILISHHRGLVGLGFVISQDRAAALKDMQGRWPAADFRHAPQVTAPLAQIVFAPPKAVGEEKLSLFMLGSAFETMVWRGLLRIPAGQTTTYSALAADLGRPQAARAIGSAVGRNPLALLVPCHRVLGRNGALTGYHWGLACKQAILHYERGLSQFKD